MGKTRIVLFGSFYRGYYLLDELLHGPLSDRFLVTGVATDDVSSTFISRDRRVWQYPHRVEEELMVEKIADANRIPVHKGRVKAPDFYETYEQVWMPDICIGATFGQRIDERLLSYPPLGFFNVHPSSGDQWPSRFAGPNPFKAMLEEPLSCMNAAFHRMNEGIDAGELIAFSPRMAIPPFATVVDMHKLSSPLLGRFATSELAKIVDAAAPANTFDVIEGAPN